MATLNLIIINTASRLTGIAAKTKATHEAILLPVRLQSVDIFVVVVVVVACFLHLFVFLSPSLLKFFLVENLICLKWFKEAGCLPFAQNFQKLRLGVFFRKNVMGWLPFTQNFQIDAQRLTGTAERAKRPFHLERPKRENRTISVVRISVRPENFPVERTKRSCSVYTPTEISGNFW